MPDPFLLRLKTLIVTTLKLDGVQPTDIPDDEPLIGSARFGLDSIDVLEIALAISKRYGFQLRSDDPANRRIFASVRSLSAHIAQYRTR